MMNPDTPVTKPNPFNFKNLLNIQLSTACSLPFWAGPFSYSLMQKQEVLYSSKPGDLKHVNFVQSFKDIGRIYRPFWYLAAFQPIYPVLIAGQQYAINDKNSFTKNLGITALISGSTALIANPLDVAILRIQKKPSHMTNREIIKQTYIKHGLPVFFNGFPIFFARNAVYGSGMLCLEPYLNKKLEYNVGTSSVMASVLANIMIAPCEVVSIMRQSENYTKMRAKECLRSVFVKHGLSGYTAGLPCRIFANAIEIYLFHSMYGWLNRNKYYC
jgi:hypothetical protein